MQHLLSSLKMFIMSLKGKITILFSQSLKRMMLKRENSEIINHLYNHLLYMTSCETKY